MGIVLRGCLAGLTAVSTYFFAFWVPGSLLLSSVESRWPRDALSLLCAILAAGFVWRSTSRKQLGSVGSSPRPTRFMLLGALLVGAAGFSVGFFGPIIFWPDANQGPLLGLFFLGPLGALVGAIGGRIWWAMKRRHEEKDEDAG